MHGIARQHHGLQRVGQLVDVQHGHAAQLRHPVEVVIVGDDLAAEDLGGLDQLAIDLADVREVEIVDLHGHLGDALQPLQDVEAALAPVALQAVG